MKLYQKFINAFDVARSWVAENFLKSNGRSMGHECRLGFKLKFPEWVKTSRSGNGCFAQNGSLLEA